ncbi:MAG: CoA-transferase [Spirochaetota bacterium]
MFDSVEIFPTPERMLRRTVKPGMYLHFASTMSRPNALINSLVRTFYKKESGFTISCTGLHSNANSLALSGIVKKAIITFAGDNFPRPSPNRLYKSLMQNDPFEVELWSILTMVQRLIAGAMRLPGIITSSLLDSHLATDKIGTSLYIFPSPLREQDYPVISPEQVNDELGTIAIYSEILEKFKANDSLPLEPLGEAVKEESLLAMLTPLIPDYAFVHGAIADDLGNVLLSPPLGEGIWGALAARNGVLATVERIVPYGTIPPEFITIPHSRVKGICEAPYGAHPQSLRINEELQIPGLRGLETYCDDYDFIMEANEATGSRQLEDREKWLQKYILLKGGHEEYLSIIGEERMTKLKRKYLKEQYKNIHVKRNSLKSIPITDSEQMIILTARSIIELVIRHKYKTVLAGIGAAHMSAWLAAKMLEVSDFPIMTLAELGFYGFSPQEGDTFLFSQMHGNKAQQLTDVTQILGTQVSKECLGVLGAAEVDLEGNLNSTMLSNGRFLVGSGGANDIASTADCLVVAKAHKERFIPKVNFITSPGYRVQQIVCQFGRFRRRRVGDKRVLYFNDWMAPPSDPKITPAKALEEYTSWDLPLEKPFREEPITLDEREILMHLDPKKLYR